MIDEDLYQQAADELNSDKRRQHIWARACALASDDHDEARFLYTNLRVEELLAERNNSVSSESAEDDETEATLALAPVEDDTDTDTDESVENQEDEFLSDMGLGRVSADTPESYSAPAGVAGPEAKEDALTLELADDVANSDDISSIGDDISSIAETTEPDPDLMSDYVPEKVFTPDSDLEDTHVDESLIEKMSQSEAADYIDDHSDTSAFIGSDLGIDGSTDPKPETSNDNVTRDATVSEDMTSELTAALDDDLTESNMVVLEAHTSELDDMLEDAYYKPPKPEEPDTEMAWLEEGHFDNEDEPELEGDNSEQELVNKHEPVIYEEDTFTEELNRQADELGILEEADQTADLSREELEEDSSVLPAAAMTAAAAGTALLASEPDLQSPSHNYAGTINETDSTTLEREFPLDLTQGRAGKLFSVFNRNGDTQAVKSGVSWSALFLTLPFLLYRKLFGTALAYILLWIIAMGGLVICGLAWLDAGTAVTPIIQAGTIGFALLAFIGLVYLPFRHANAWRSEKLEDHGYELVATTRAKNTHLAVARARRHIELDS